MEIIKKIPLCIILILGITAHAAEPYIIVIGAGPAGLTAAITIKQQLPEINVTIIKSNERGQLESTDSIDNWPGHHPISGEQLLKKIEKKAINLGVTIEHDHIEEISHYGYETFIHGKNKTYISNLVIVATGATPNIPEILKPLLGKGVYTCTTCDGPKMIDKKAIVLGSGSHAAESSLALNKLNADVTMVVRGNHLKSEQVLIDRLSEHSEISKLYNHEILEVSFDNEGNINGTVFQGDGKYPYLATQGIFSATGQKPQTDFLKNRLSLDTKNYLKCQNHSKMPCMITGEDSTLLTLGNTTEPLLNTLTSAAKGAKAALILSKTLSNKYPDKKNLTIAVIGGGFGGGTASLYAMRNQLNVILLEGEPPRKIKKVWPLSETRPRPLKILNQQLNSLGVTRTKHRAIKIGKDHNDRYQIITEGGKVEVDGIIINTLEYSAEKLITASFPEHLPVNDFSQEFQWFHTSAEGILAAGDVISPRQHLPKQAILAAYDGFLAGILAVQKIKNTEDYFSINSD